MKCPHCGAPRSELRVLETSHTDDQVRRRRKCSLCEQRFSTVEVLVADNRRTSTKNVVLVPKELTEALTGR